MHTRLARVSGRLLLPAVLLASSWSCGGKSSNSPSSTVCSEVSVNQNGDLGISACNSIRSNISNIQYDRFSRPVSYNFSITCVTTNKTYSGDVSLNYNNIGQVTSSTVRVNGQTCQK